MNDGRTGNYHDPLTFRLFTQHTPIIAIKTSGNVYAKDSVDRLNVKAGFWRDLITDEPFTRSDLITLQDPHNPDQRDLTKFKHLDADLKPAAEDLPEQGLRGINVNNIGGASRIIQSLNKGKEKAIPEPIIPEPSTSTEKEPEHEPWNASKFTTGHTAASLTSTSAPVFTKTERALYDEDELMFEAIKEKAYVKLKTNFGDLNVELFCDKVSGHVTVIVYHVSHSTATSDRRLGRAIIS